jgi:DNA-binding response OmpR family regulator
MGSKVLLFDEDEAAAGELQAALAKLGCDVTLLTEDAFGGGWTVALAVKEGFDVILVAADPPAMSGLGVCDRLKQDERTRSVPVLMLGADVDAFEAHKQLPTHADDYIGRPADSTELPAAVRKRISAVMLAASAGERLRGRLPSLPAEELDLDDALVVESNVPRQRSIPPPVPGADAAPAARLPGPALLPATGEVPAEVPADAPAVATTAEADEDKKRTARSSRVAAREARDQRKLQRELEKELEGLKSRLQAAEREHEAQLARAEKERSAARTDRELATKRAEEQARRIERGKADLEQSRQQIATAAEEHAAALDARDRAHEQKVARIHTEQGQAQAVMLANALRAVREDVDAKMASVEQEHRVALESQACDHTEALAALGREGDARRAAELAKAEGDFEVSRSELANKLDDEAARARKLEEELAALQAVRGDLERDRQRLGLERNAQRENHEAALEGAAANTRDRVRAVERALGEERAAAEAEWKAERVRLAAEREEEAARARALEEQLQVLQAAKDDLERERERLARELDAARREHEAALERAARDAQQRVAAVEGKLVEERAAAKADQEVEVADKERLVLALEAQRKEHEAALQSAAAASRERVRAIEHKLGEERAASEAGLTAQRQAIASERDREAARVDALEAELAAAAAAQVDHDRERAGLSRELGAVREGHEADLKKLAEQRALAEADDASLRLEIVAKRYEEQARAQALLDELRTLEAVCAADRAAAAVATAKADADWRAQRLELLAERDREAARARSLEEELGGLRSARFVPELEHLARVAAAARKDHEAALEPLSEAAAVAKAALAAEKESRRKDASAHAQALAAASARLERSIQEAESRSVILEAEQAQERLGLREAHAQELAKVDQAHEQVVAALRRELGSVDRPKTASASTPPPLDDEDTTTIEVPSVDEGAGESGARLLLIARDRETRADLSRALARTGCEVVVRDSCANVASGADDFDVIVTEVVGVGIEQLLEAFARKPPAAQIIASATRVEATRRMFQSTGLGSVSVILKASRPDTLVAAVRAQLDTQKGRAAPREGAVPRDARRRKGAR